MAKLKINLENCYGIKKFSHELEISDKRAHAIYAPNGSMKTSLARTFTDFMGGQESKDEVHADRKTKREITFSNGQNLNPENVLVIGALDIGYKSEKESLLLVNEELKQEYEQIIQELESKCGDILSILAKRMGVKDVLPDLFRIFKTQNKFEMIQALYVDLNESLASYIDVPYKLIFNDNVFSFCREKTFQKSILEYLENYDKLIEQSSFLKKDFDHNKAKNVYNALGENNFFKANHSVILEKDGNTKEIKTEEELSALIDTEVKSIMSNKNLSQSWEGINKKLNKNISMKDFTSYLIRNKEVLPELLDIDGFQNKVIRSYLLDSKGMIENFVVLHEGSQSRISKIIEQAKHEKTAWAASVDLFNTRFDVPFRLKITNKDEAVLGIKAPALSFEFDDVSIDMETLYRILSQGERRALYILRVLFEIHGRQVKQTSTVIVIDDIADSFDYKNKYAIVEYLNDIAKNDFFFLLILTHNFDFFRTLESRFVGFENCSMVSKTAEGTELVSFIGYKNPFLGWKKNNFVKVGELVASIAFARNLIEYTHGQNHSCYKKLTSLLHWKEDSSTITLKEFKEIYDTFFEPKLVVVDETRVMLDLIFEEANKCLDKNEKVGIESKIIMSIAIRIKMEQILVLRIGTSFWKEIQGKAFQTKLLSNKFKEMFPSDEFLKLIEKVNIMTPENIHINSFMFEPILDMSDDHLKTLYLQLLTFEKTL